ncbi:argininosuccinate lyase [Oceanobacillus jeddahense]|uniref:argininosuccinate lyase n=1 Tax=Oceanobacillus jeddahense TaxID=1462527 RepID=UPI00362BCCEF
MKERLKNEKAEEVIKYVIEPSIKAELVRSFDNLMYVNKAHLKMIVETEIIDRSIGREILRGLNELIDEGSNNLQIDYNIEELYLNMEKALIEKVGIKAGGILHIGRSRNDLLATVTRMNSRDSIFNILKKINILRNEILIIAKDNVETIISGYTHMQPAEPITLSHYLSALLFAVERDFKRLIATYKQINTSPLGAGSMGSTNFNIDRDMTAEILEFDTVMNNSLDSIASRDYSMEALSSLALYSNNLSRIAQDLYIWSTDEFNYVEVDDSVSIGSSIMPQKKNPVTLEHIKAKAAHVLGAYVSTFSTLKNISYGHSRDTSTESMKYYWDAFHEVESITSLMIATLRNIKFNKSLMRERTLENFTTVTELANTLVRKTDISFRQAHHIVGFMVREMIEEDIDLEQVNSEMVNKYARVVIGEDIIYSDKDVSISLDPEENVYSKTVKGGPAPSEVNRQLDEISNNLEEDNIWLNTQVGRIEKMKMSLDTLQL